jgi:HEPN domain-containing protein
MKPPEAELRLSVEAWVRKADLDFRAVERLLLEQEFRELVGFLAQQSAEKYLKALLTRHQIDFPKTHEIRLLLELLSPVEPELRQSLAAARWLEPFAVQTRYPGDRADTLPGDELRAHELARHVRQEVMARLDPFLSG